MNLVSPSTFPLDRRLVLLLVLIALAIHAAALLVYAASTAMAAAPPYDGPLLAPFRWAPLPRTLA